MGALTSPLALLGCGQRKIDQTVDRVGDITKRMWQSAKPDDLLFKGIVVG